MQYKKYININTNESTHSEMGPERQNPAGWANSIAGEKLSVCIYVYMCVYTVNQGDINDNR